MTLDKIPVGEICGVTGMDLPRQVGRRLEALGLTLGTRVLVLGKKSGALILEVRGTRFAVGQGITRKIEVA